MVSLRSLTQVGLSLAIVLPALAASSFSAGAITAELAKKCREMAFKSHPPAVIGSKTSNAKAQQDYFKACVDKDGKLDDKQ